MEFYEVLQSILDEKGLSIPDAARLCGLSDSTVRTILNRKNKSVSLEVAFKLSTGLGVSFERLNYGAEGVAGGSVTEILNLSDTETDLILAYRRASNDDRIIVDAALRKYMADECLKGDAEKMA